MKATDIRWVETYEGEREHLPKEIDIPKKITSVEAISNYVTNFAHCRHLGFVIRYSKEEIKEHEKKHWLAEPSINKKVKRIMSKRLGIRL